MSAVVVAADADEDTVLDVISKSPSVGLEP